MCEYCAEIHPINMAADLTEGKSIDFNDKTTFGFYLEECQDIQHAITQESESLQYLSNTMDDLEQSENDIDNFWFEIIFCRTIQILVTKDFDSADYQILISNPLVDRIVRYEFKHLLPFENKYLPSTTLTFLFNDRVFTEKESWNNLISQPSLISDCENFLIAYIDLWSIDWHAEDRQEFKVKIAVFQKNFSLVFFSAIVLAKHNCQNEVLFKLIKSEPVPFHPLELWLQRKIFLMIYDAVGLAPFLPYRDIVRSGLMYYLVVSKKITVAEKEMLKKEIIGSQFYEYYCEMLESGEYKANDPTNPRPFHIFLEPYLLEHL